MSSGTELIMLGTGNAVVTKCYNTCFAFRNNEEYTLIDAGGGNGILAQLEKAHIPVTGIHTLFITHAHTDHILGAVWMVRAIGQAIQKGEYKGTFRIYAHDKAIEVLQWICRMTLPKKIVSHIGHSILITEVKDGDCFEANGMDFQCFDIQSTKEKQFGFTATLAGQTKIACLGDEPYNPANEQYVNNADWLLCEAFCLYADRDIFKPYEKHHSTALDAGKLAQELNVNNLLLFHTEDKTIDTRKETYSAEASVHFDKNIFVPEDLERIQLT
ncbi:MAG: MBL fold metallo-hydrolase [Bacteroidales bacterium]